MERKNVLEEAEEFHGFRSVQSCSRLHRVDISKWWTKDFEKDSWGRISMACVFGFTCHVSTPSLSGQCTAQFHPFSKRQITTASVQRFPVTHCLSPVRTSGFCKSLRPTTFLFPRRNKNPSLSPFSKFPRSTIQGGRKDRPAPFSRENR